MKPFDGVDFLELDTLLTEEEIGARRRAREFVDGKVMPLIAGCFERHEFPAHLVPEMGKAGFLGADLQGYGCAGTGHTAYGLIMQELERGDSAMRTFASVQSALVMYPIHVFGSEEHKAHWLPKLASGEAIGCFGLTEPDHGSDPGSMTTRARREGDAIVLEGRKKWIGNATIADVALVWAKNEEGIIEGHLVGKENPGLSSSLITGKFSLRAAVTGVLDLAACRIPARDRLPGASGLKAALSCLDKARFGIAWGAIGAAMACYHEAVEYAKQRTQFGRPIASFQLVQETLADMLTEITKMQFVTLQLSRLMEKGRATPYHISMLKRNNVEKALDIARAARDILGANGICLDYQSGRHLCNLESVKTYEGTHNIHTLILGEYITRHRAFS